MNTQVHNGYEYVDLGLPSGLKWATCNIGAESPEHSGMYFTWGETKGYTIDDINSNIRSFNKLEYKYNSASLISDDLIDKCDAAYIYMRGSWRTPINKDFTELIKNTYKTWIDDYNKTGVSGLLLTSKTNGNSIFFPECGGYALDESLARTVSKIKNFDPTEYRDNPHKESYYWVGTVKGGFFPFLKIENGSNSYRWMYEMNGSCCFAVRPVADK